MSFKEFRQAVATHNRQGVCVSDHPSGLYDTNVFR